MDNSWKKCALKDDFHCLLAMLPCQLLMSGAPVELRVAGHTYRVVASAEADVLHRLAAVVDAKVNEVTLPGRQVSPQSMLLAAISLAHELEEERAKRVRLEERAREMFGTLLERVDAALAGSELTERESAASPHSQEHADDPRP